jgi:hypothetical protein
MAELAFSDHVSRLDAGDGCCGVSQTGTSSSSQTRHANGNVMKNDLHTQV